MTPEEQLEQEYEAAPEQMLMAEDEYNRFQNLSPAEQVRESPDARPRYFATAKFHVGQRLKLFEKSITVEKRSKGSDALVVLRIDEAKPKKPKKPPKKR